tara:strand:- start:2769 stop:3098 length:330 start_codon:yes stop_codon:yes gene_type:complete
VPQLRHDRRTLGVHSIYNLLPGWHRRTEHRWHRLIMNAASKRNRHPLGDNQAHAMRRSLCVIPDDVLRWDPLRREATRHRRHHDTIAQFEISQLERLKQTVDVLARHGR